MITLKTLSFRWSSECFVPVRCLVTTFWNSTIKRCCISRRLHDSNLLPVGVQTRWRPLLKFKPSVRIDASVRLWLCCCSRGLKKIRRPGGSVFYLMVVCRGQDSCACNSTKHFLHLEAWGGTSGCSRRTRWMSLLSVTYSKMENTNTPCGTAFIILNWFIPLVHCTHPASDLVGFLEYLLRGNKSKGAVMSKWTKFSKRIFSSPFWICTLNTWSGFWMTKRLRHSRGKVKGDEYLRCGYIPIQGLGLFCFLGRFSSEVFQHCSGMRLKQEHPFSVTERVLV